MLHQNRRLLIAGKVSFRIHCFSGAGNLCNQVADSGINDINPRGLVPSVLQTRVERPFDKFHRLFVDLSITPAAAVILELFLITNQGASPLEIPARQIGLWTSRHLPARGDLRSQKPGARMDPAFLIPKREQNSRHVSNNELIKGLRPLKSPRAGLDDGTSDIVLRAGI